MTQEPERPAERSLEERREKIAQVIADAVYQASGDNDRGVRPGDYAKADQIIALSERPEPRCSTCGGDPSYRRPHTDLLCICANSTVPGTLVGEVQGLRLANINAETALDRAEEVLAERPEVEREPDGRTVGSANFGDGDCVVVKPKAGVYVPLPLGTEVYFGQPSAPSPRERTHPLGVKPAAPAEDARAEALVRQFEAIIKEHINATAPEIANMAEAMVAVVLLTDELVSAALTEAPRPATYTLPEPSAPATDGLQAEVGELIEVMVNKWLTEADEMEADDDHDGAGTVRDCAYELRRAIARLTRDVPEGEPPIVARGEDQNRKPIDGVLHCGVCGVEYEWDGSGPSPHGNGRLRTYRPSCNCWRRAARDSRDGHSETVVLTRDLDGEFFDSAGNGWMMVPDTAVSSDSDSI